MDENLQEIQMKAGAPEREPLEWSAPEYHHTHKNSDWYWAVGIISLLSIAVTAIIFDNILFGVVILLSAFSMCLYSARKPDLVEMRMDDNGVYIGEYKYQYKTIESFGIDLNSIQPRVLLLKSHKLFMPFISLPLGNMHPDIIREYLKVSLPEEEHAEPLLHKVLEYLGF